VPPVLSPFAGRTLTILRQRKPLCLYSFVASWYLSFSGRLSSLQLRARRPAAEDVGRDYEHRTLPRALKQQRIGRSPQSHRLGFGST